MVAPLWMNCWWNRWFGSTYYTCAHKLSGSWAWCILTWWIGPLVHDTLQERWNSEYVIELNTSNILLTFPIVGIQCTLATWATTAIVLVFCVLSFFLFQIDGCCLHHLSDSDTMTLQQTKMNCLQKGNVFVCWNMIYMAFIHSIDLVFNTLQFWQKVVTCYEIFHQRVKLW